MTQSINIRDIFVKANNIKELEPFVKELKVKTAIERQKLENPIYQTTPHFKRSNRYTFISTEEMLGKLKDRGFEMVSNKFAKANESNQGFQRHEIVLQSSQLPEDKTKSMQLSLKNSHNGSCGFSLGLRVYVRVCSNGLYVNKSVGSINMRHQGEINQTLNYSIDQMLEYSQRAWLIMGKMENTFMTLERQNEFAEKAVGIRWGENQTIPYQPYRLLEGFHLEQEHCSVWNIYNRIQSNLMRGQNYVSDKGKYRKTQAIRSLERNIKMNRELFTLAETFV